MDNLNSKETLKQKSTTYSTITSASTAPSASAGTASDIAILLPQTSQSTAVNPTYTQLYNKQSGSWSTNFNTSSITQKIVLPIYGQTQVPSPLSPGFASTLTGYSSPASSAIWATSYSDWYTGGVGAIPWVDTNGFYSPSGSGAYCYGAKGTSVLGSDHMAFFAGMYKVITLPETNSYYGAGLGGNGYGIQFLVTPDGRLVISQNEGSMYSASLAATSSSTVQAGYWVYMEKYGRRFTGKVFNGNTQVGSTIEWSYVGTTVGYAALLGMQGLMVSTSSSAGRFNNLQFWG